LAAGHSFTILLAIPGEPTTQTWANILPARQSLPLKSQAQPSYFPLPNPFKPKLLPGFASVRLLFCLPPLHATLKPSRADCVLCAFPFRVDRAHPSHRVSRFRSLKTEYFSMAARVIGFEA